MKFGEIKKKQTNQKKRSEKSIEIRCLDSINASLYRKTNREKRRKRRQEKIEKLAEKILPFIDFF